MKYRQKRHSGVFFAFKVYKRLTEYCLREENREE